MRQLVKMDEGALNMHAALTWTDDCYYLLDFTPGKRYGFHPDNDLIKNFKRRIDRSGFIALKRKEWATREIAYLLRPALAGVVDFSRSTIIPIPPSKLRSHPFFDDRVSQVLRAACRADADIRELIVCRSDQEAVHERFNRPSLPELFANYMLGEAGSAPVRETVVLFDDMVTSGKHFVACRKFLREHFPGREVIGVFVARRVLGG